MELQSFPSYKEIVLDSRSRMGGTLDEPVFIIPTTEGLRFKLRSAVIPIAWYATSTISNVLQFTEGTVTSVLTASIPVGNYAIDSLASAVGTAMNAVGGQTYTVSSMSTSGKLSFTSSSRDFTLLASSSLGYQIGLDETANSSSTSKSLSAPWPVDVSGPRMLVISCPQVRSSSMLGGSFDKCAVRNPNLKGTRRRAHI